ncbi:hypothetical protein ORN01_22160 [Bacillus cereus]|uniref:hypothetical protein n=1 Tax=Bacillus cereus group TaxID=86661 RepID=UPI000279D219|nr:MULTISPECIES: hypothetical protein [Bacillus cereus group]EJR73635.1 hypothetical protein IK9_05170 [Bacillus cereus VD166]MDZ4631678.1 hypothetical protein [Bacillus cereus]PGX74527.1 hypothetical protein COE45_28605 [Bacillus thuringiensis]RKI21598.1 hypothetical protein D7V71_24130 [Bacillus thuringiensis]USL10747.1 hypothetical protein LIT24_28810 [Bacillus bombysepticus]
MHFDLNFSELVCNLKIEKIIIFGNLTMKSNDLDLLIVSDDYEVMYNHKRIKISKKFIHSIKKLDLICLTLKEFNELQIRPNQFSINILTKGEVLYERRI